MALNLPSPESRVPSPESRPMKQLATNLSAPAVDVTGRLAYTLRDKSLGLCADEPELPRI